MMDFNCRVMLGGEIYYRAIGRPWGPAADFIGTVKLHQLTIMLVGWEPPARGWSHSFESGRVQHPRATRPSRPSVRLSDGLPRVGSRCFDPGQ